MSQITLTDPVFYKNGVPGQSKVAGFESGVTRVARYTFLAPQTGATSLQFSLDGTSKGAGLDIPLRFAISTDPDSHCNAGANSPYTGVATLTLSSHLAQGQAEVRLTPGVTYYLWLFPGENVWGWYYVPASGTVTTSGFAEGVATVEDGILGQPLDITIHSTPGYTHRLTWEFAGLSGTIGESLEDTAIWTPPLELAEAIPSSQSGICTLTCYSFQDGVSVGSPHSTDFTLTVPSSFAPQLAVTLTDTSPAREVLGYYVGKVTKLEVTVTTTVFYGATLVSTAITLDGEPYTGKTLTAGAHTIAVTVTDSRGMSAAWQENILVGAYTVPQLEIHASRCRADGTADDTGDHAIVTLRGSVEAFPGNTAALILRYSGEKLELPVEVGQFEATAIIPADPNETLTIRGILQDALKEVTRSMTLSTGYPTMEFYRGGKGIAFGMVPTAEGFQCAMDTQFFGKVTDGQGRSLIARHDLEPVTGMYLTPIYGRVLEVLGTGFLQLKFTCNRYLDAGDQLFTAELPITEELTVKDINGNYSLTLTPTGIITPSSLPTGTHTFHCLLY